jgi:cytosine deaminase
MGAEEYLKSRGVEVVVLDNAESYQLMQTFIKENPSQW